MQYKYIVFRSRIYKIDKTDESGFLHSGINVFSPQPTYTLEEAEAELSRQLRAEEQRIAALPEYERILMNLPDINDGIYDVSGLEFMRVDTRKPDEIVQFYKKHPNTHKAEAYETDTIILISDMPKLFMGNRIGYGFNYGSTNVLTNCPDSILILAEND